MVRFIISINKTVAPKQTNPSSPIVSPWCASRTALYSENW